MTAVLTRLDPAGIEATRTLVLLAIARGSLAWAIVNG